jgi:dsDNA-specific endonuclease/ATPase MutS2
MKAFKVGDTVSVLDDDLSGRITKIQGDIITIETDDGFNLDFEKYEVVRISGPLHVDLSENDIIEKELPKRKNRPKTKVKERFQPPLEVDLHIHQLTDAPRRMTNHDMLTLQLDTARRQLEFAIHKRIQKVVFIHGKGEGVLKMELEYLFGRYNNLKYYDADYQKYGLGATEVYIFQNVKPEL